MKRLFIVFAMALMAIGTNAQDDAQLGYWTRRNFVKLTPDNSLIYKYVQAMDDESQQAIEALFADMKEKNDKSILKRNEGGWYVRNDYSLPEGNYYKSDFYNNSIDNDNKLYFILPRYEFFMNSKGNITDLLNFLGNTVTLESESGPDISGCTDYKLKCNMRTSEEVLEAGMRVHEKGFEGLPHFIPKMLWLDRDYNSNTIHMLTDDKQTSESLVYEMNWEGVPYYTSEESEGVWEASAEGLAITNPQMQEQKWQSQTFVTTDRFSLEKGHNYIVRLTLKVPSDGTYQVLLGSLATNFIYQVPVTASEDFQMIDFEFPKFAEDAEYVDGLEGGCLVILQNGWVVGTTVVKKVEVIEKIGSSVRGDMTAINTVKALKTDDAIYNLAGQRVDASYKGVVIQNGKKRIMK